MAGKIRRFFTNIICGCIYNKDARKRVRVMLNSPMSSYIRFIRRDIDAPIKKIKTFTGYQARNLLISVNDEYIYKFPLRRNNSDELTIRESRIVGALSPVSPIYIPPVTVLRHRGVLVRRYPFIHGVRLREIPTDIALKNVNKLAPQIAQFLHSVATSNPSEISDLKPAPDDMPGYQYGWFHGDIGDNFFIDINTMQIIAFIDWEDCYFGDFSATFTGDRRSPNRELMRAAKREYDKLYNKGIL